MRIIRDFYSTIGVTFFVASKLCFGILCFALVTMPWLPKVNSEPLKDLVFIVGLDKPPYIITQSESGYELDLLKLVANEMGYRARFVHVPNGRILSTFADGTGDFATLIKQPVANFYMTDTFVYYQNVIVSLQNSAIESLHQFAGKKIIGFQRAQQILGNDFNNAVKSASFYQEITNQKTQVEMLLLGRCDGVVMERNIFYHFYHSSAQHHANVYLSYPFNKTEYHALARSEQLSAQFNRALSQVRSQESFKELQLKYFKELNQVPKL